MKTYNNYKAGITSRSGCMRSGLSRCNRDLSENIQSNQTLYSVIRTYIATILLQFKVIGDGKLYNHNESGTYNKTGWF